MPAPGIGISGMQHRDSASGKSDDALATAPFQEITPQLVKAEQEARNSRATQDISALIKPATPYTIESGDVLSIVVWDHPELNGAAASQTPMATPESTSGTSPLAGFIVDHEGQIQFPFAGAIKVSGLTEERARDLLATKLARYITKPNITLRVQSYRSKRIYVDGEVRQPGVYSINDIPMTLIEAINRTGGMLPSADQSRLSLSRQGTTYSIDLPEMVQRGVNPATVLLQDGDVLRVRSRDESKVFVSGEVVAPRALTMHNGRLSLNEALGESGGINPMSGDARQIYVVRRSATEPTVFRLDAQAPGALAMAEGFELNPKDLVYVAATPLTNWHRTISQILPGALTSAFSAVTQPK
jgi:polysaccharide export outer membrane protein